ncbi:MAG: BREX system P-loop protein BrxC [Caldilineaceae bacterium]|nr:BREX system P-loop protein BrxC [Caldilineaceae bacterium]MCB9140467.1 BREX system P-loop protein BrxC [Caldilineaceae bacterium]
MQIRELFDSSKDINRVIEKVITYDAAQEAHLKAEIPEYIVTDNIEDQFEQLLMKMQYAMETGAANEVGVWVSGFYGSGKSSFTKYLGFALDDDVQIDGEPFLKSLQNRMHRARTRQMLSKVAHAYPAAVIMLDLASDMLAGNTMEEVSTVLYYKVLQWAGYSQNLKVAYLERLLRRDGRYDEFTARILEEYDVPWSEMQNDPHAVDDLLPPMAHEFYPNRYKTPTSFTTDTEDIVRFESDRVQEMLDIVREHSGKEYAIFIIDEVGQYVAPRQHLILNLDGLAKNLKNLGDGKVWIVGTAQQTLTEDDPRAALNSPELFRLEARFPIKIDLESGDIKEICYRRLLGKSPDGEQELKKLFVSHGQSLRHNTKLEDAEYYNGDFDEGMFTNLYPFLPVHFDVLLQLLSILAKYTGGIGLRSAIKIIQDILIDHLNDHPPMADQPVGCLATLVTFYDVLEKDFERAAPSIHNGLVKAQQRFPISPLHQHVAKAVAVLQVMENIPVTAQNITALLHPSVDSPSRREDVDAALDDLSRDVFVPFGEQDGSYRFFSEKLNDIAQERANLLLRSSELSRIQNNALQAVFSPLPATRLHNTLTVRSGLKTWVGGMQVNLDGDRETIQTVIELVEPEDYENNRTHLVEISREPSARHTIYLIARHHPDLADLNAEIYRCREIAQNHRSEPDQEVRDYCRAQLTRAETMEEKLRHELGKLLLRGSFVFRGQMTAVETLDPKELAKATNKYLGTVAEQVFDRYDEAPHRAQANLAERFMRLPNLRATDSATDPLDLVQLSGGQPEIDINHQALVSIRDFLAQHGWIDGKVLLSRFSDAPFGWSQDTLRYLIAALLLAGEIKLRVAGREITVNGQNAIDALKNNTVFKNVGVTLRESKTPTDVLARAADRLTQLIGEPVLAFPEDEISKAATRHFPRYQRKFGPLAEKLANLDLPGAQRIHELNQVLTDVLLTDASDLPQRLGAPESPLFTDLSWAIAVQRAFDNGLESTIRALQQHRRIIEGLPPAGVPGKLRSDLRDELAHIAQRLQQTTFYDYSADLNTALTAVKARIRHGVEEIRTAQEATIRTAQQELLYVPGWDDLTKSERDEQVNRLDQLRPENDNETNRVAEKEPGRKTKPFDLVDLQEAVRQDYIIQTEIDQVRSAVQRLGRERRLQKIEEEVDQLRTESDDGPVSPKITRKLSIPARITHQQQLEPLVRELQDLRSQLTVYPNLEIIVTLTNDQSEP